MRINVDGYTFKKKKWTLFLDCTFVCIYLLTFFHFWFLWNAQKWIRREKILKIQCKKRHNEVLVAHLKNRAQYGCSPILWVIYVITDKIFLCLFTLRKYKKSVHQKLCAFARDLCSKRLFSGYELKRRFSLHFTESMRNVYIIIELEITERIVSVHVF